MRVKLDIDATPEEFRRVMGLPDVSGLNDELTDRLRERILEAVEGQDSQALLRQFLSQSFGGLDAFQTFLRQAWSGDRGKDDD